MSKKYAHYGCALTAPQEWDNFDVSPTLQIQQVPIIGRLLKNQLNIIFPDNVKYGNIIKGLPITDNSCDGVYCSHVLEHLSLSDFRKALKNTYQILKPNGIFRCVVPDLETAAKTYVKALSDGDGKASIQFMNTTLLGKRNRPRGFKGFLEAFLGNSNHLWMWDHNSLMLELKVIGFRDIRPCKIHDCEDKMFNLVEKEDRFVNAVAIECKK